jgi:hypothetical protein
MIKRILIPLDPSPYTETALEMACFMAKHHHAELTAHFTWAGLNFIVTKRAQLALDKSLNGFLSGSTAALINFDTGFFQNIRSFRAQLSLTSTSVPASTIICAVLIPVPRVRLRWAELSR